MTYDEAMKLKKRELAYIVAEKSICGTPGSVYEHAKAVITNWDQEHMIVLCLDGAGKVIRKKVVFIGTTNQALIHPREIFTLILQTPRVANFIIVHNHPSGTLSPSTEDIRVTERLVKVGKLMGIEMLDHVILSEMGYYSCRQHGYVYAA